MQVWSRHACSDSAPASDANNNSDVDDAMRAASPKLEVAQIMGYLLSVAIKVVDHCIEVGTKCSNCRAGGAGSRVDGGEELGI